ncbi:2021_t:CDS:1, partial [Funneliformis geosporum]
QVGNSIIEIENLNNRLTELSSNTTSDRYRARYRALRDTHRNLISSYNGLRFRLNYSQSEVTRLQGLETVEQAQALARDVERLRRNFSTLFRQLQKR